ncbi:hypothetical protein [Corynebacterium glyciniphilum]|uniref:hypothetical protein n=1 Tax=Corynebacterium glyciniphilum TaxID=1404244 RepID=UPI003FD64E57
MAPEQAALFTPGDLDDETGLFAVQGRTAGPTVDTPTMTTAEVQAYLGISRSAMTSARNRRQIRQVSPGTYLTSTVTAHLPAGAVCTLAQALAVLDRSPNWYRQNAGRIGLVTDPVGATYRFSKVSVNKVAAGLRRVDDARQERAAIRELNTLTDTTDVGR